MPWVRFESTTPVFERTKTVRALDRAATVMGIGEVTLLKIQREEYRKPEYLLPKQKKKN
jgi:hypothetical protein